MIIERFIPALSWLKTYHRGQFSQDATGGVYRHHVADPSSHWLTPCWLGCRQKWAYTPVSYLWFCTLCLAPAHHCRLAQLPWRHS